MSDIEAIELGPIGTREEFMDELRVLAEDAAPNVFALCEEIGDRQNGCVRYWGMEFDDRVEVISVSGRMRGSFSTVEDAHRRFSRRRTMHLLWV
jgi:predicted DNA-binding protein with PD1-like motif